MNTETLEFGPFAAGCIKVIYPQDYKRDGACIHSHMFWEIKILIEPKNETQTAIITAPGAFHAETPPKLLLRGMTLSLRRPYVGMNLHAEPNKEYFIAFAKVDVLCPGGAEELMRMLAESGRQGDCRRFNAMASTLFSAIAAVIQKNNSPQTLSKAAQACEYIEHYYYRNDLSVRGVASYLGITPGHLADLFRREKRGTIRAFIIKVRLENAVRLLKMNCFIIKEIAEMTGWNNQFYFSNCFHRTYGSSPSEFMNL